MAVKKAGEVEGVQIVPQVVPKSGIITAPPKDEPRPQKPRPSTPSRPLTERQRAVERARLQKDRDPALRPFEAGTVPLIKVNRDALQILIEGFVSGEVDGDVLRETASATGTPGTTQITLSPGRQVQENRFQKLLSDLADVGTPQAKKREASTVVRIFTAIADGFNGRNAAVVRERLEQEALLRPAVAAGLKKRLPEKEYLNFLKESRWYDVLRKEVSKEEFRQTFEKNENRPLGARDEGAIEILSAAIPVGPILRATFKTIRIGIRTSGSPLRFSTQSFRRFIADETGSINFKPRKIFAGGSISEQQASKAIQGLIRAIRRAEGAGKPTDRLYDALRRFRNGSIPIRASKPPTAPPRAALDPQAAPKPVRVAERPAPVKPPAVVHAERILKKAGVETKIESAAEIGARARAKAAAAAKPVKAKPKTAEQASREARAKRIDPKSQAEFQRIAEQERLAAIARKAKTKTTGEKPKPKLLGAVKLATQTSTAVATRTITGVASAAPSEAPQPMPAGQPAPNGEPTRPKVLIPRSQDVSQARPPPKEEPQRGKGIRPPGDPATFEGQDFSFDLPRGTFARKVIYRQGAFWVTLTLDGSDPIFSRTKPPSARTGKTPKQTFKVIEFSERRPTQKMFDQGRSRVTVGGGGIRFRGI